MNLEIRALLDKAKESVEAAELLGQRNFHGYAASRAYYAMFYAAEALLASLGQSYSSHAAVLSAFGREFAKTKILDEKFHRWLLDAQDYRNIGDYAISAHVSPGQGEQVCQWAREFIEVAEGYLRREGS